MGFDELTPRQLAPSVGKNSAGLTVFSVPSENGNSPIASTYGNSPAASTNQNSPIRAAHGNSPTHSTNGSTPASPAKSTSDPLTNFEPHSPEARETFASLESGLDLTVGSFNFFVNKLGTQDLTDPRQLATSAPEAPSIAAPSTADPSTASVQSSILEACSSATTMSTREINEYLTKELQGEEAESAYHKSSLELDVPLDDTLDCGISFDDFD